MSSIWPSPALSRDEGNNTTSEHLQSLRTETSRVSLSCITSQAVANNFGPPTLGIQAAVYQSKTSAVAYCLSKERHKLEIWLESFAIQVVVHMTQKLQQFAPYPEHGSC